jgi:(E)-4-hydroxy-3-methylbut-2-enyl-diphosphate synthase
VAKALIEIRDQRTEGRGQKTEISFDPFSYQRRTTKKLEREGVQVGGDELVRVVIRKEQHQKIAHKIDKMGDYKPEIVFENAEVIEVDPRDDESIAHVNNSAKMELVTVKDGIDLPMIAAFRLLAAKLQPRHPIVLKDTLRRVTANDEARMVRSGATLNDEGSLNDQMTKRSSDFKSPSSFLHTLLIASTNIGSLLCDGIGDAILMQGEEAPGQSLRLSYNILQAAGARIFKTDYVACPSCGRTLFNLQTTTARIKAATVHLKGVKIAIMGCIVNGPGEMADADFGYVGGAPGKVNLYVGKQAVKFNIPEAEAVDRLKDLIRERGKWVEPAAAQPALAEANA